jgi:hypothetical protein
MQDEPVSPPQWQFQPEQTTGQPPVRQAPSPVLHSQLPVQSADSIQWTASEFLSHQKDANWYLILSLAGFGVSGLVFLVTGDIISTLTVIFVAVMLGIVAARKPRTLLYQLSDEGMQIDKKFYPFADFKSFSVINEGAINSILLIPLKRLAPGLTMYYAPEDEQRILDALSDILPYEERKQDPVDKFMRHIRF